MSFPFYSLLVTASSWYIISMADLNYGRFLFVWQLFPECCFNKTWLEPRYICSIYILGLYQLVHYATHSRTFSSSSNSSLYQGKPKKSYNRVQTFWEMELVGLISSKYYYYAPCVGHYDMSMNGVYLNILTLKFSQFQIISIVILSYGNALHIIWITHHCEGYVTRIITEVDCQSSSWK